MGYTLDALVYKGWITGKVSLNHHLIPFVPVRLNL